MTDFLDLGSILTRVKELHEQTGLNSSEFCSECDIPSSSYSQIINGKTKLNIDIINKIIARWGREYSPMWLLFGHHSDREALPSAISPEQSSATIPELVEEVIRLREIVKTSIKPKEVDHITVYYTDRSFAVFKLSND